MNNSIRSTEWMNEGNCRNFPPAVFFPADGAGVDRARVLARLVLLPRNDPQFRRNQERVNRDAERERISVEWELGYNDAE